MTTTSAAEITAATIGPGNPGQTVETKRYLFGLRIVAKRCLEFNLQVADFATQQAKA